MLRLEGLMTVAEAAELCGLDLGAVYYWMDKGKVHTLTVGNTRYLFRDEVERLALDYATQTVRRGRPKKINQEV